MEIVLAVGFKEAAGGGDELLGGIPFLLAEGLEAKRPVGGDAALAIGRPGGRRLEEAGMEPVHAVGPVKAAGPFFDGGQAFVELVGDGLQGVGVAEVEVGQEGAEGARRFAGSGRETRRGTGIGGGRRRGGRRGGRFSKRGAVRICICLF